MPTLYNISEELLNIFNNIESGDGEITDEQYNDLCIKQEELKEKLDNYVKAIKEFQANADFCKKEKQSINDRQNVFKNRVERLKSAVLDAVTKFGEQGKNNMFIELPYYRVFTKNSKAIQVDETRVNILLSELDRYMRELVYSDALYTGEDVDLQGILDCINANVIAEQGKDFEPFTLSDLNTFTISITSKASIYELFKNHNYAIREYVENSLSCSISDETSKENWKISIENAETANLPKPSIASVVNNVSLQIK